MRCLWRDYLRRTTAAGWRGWATRRDDGTGETKGLPQEALSSCSEAYIQSALRNDADRQPSMVRCWLARSTSMAESSSFSGQQPHLAACAGSA